MPRHFKVHELLDRAELDALEEFAREPARTVDQCHEWLLSRGYTISRTAVLNWKQQFVEQDKFRASHDVARVILDAAKEKGVASIGDAAGLKIGQMVFETMLRLQESDEVSPRELMQAATALKQVITGSRHLEKLKDEVAQRQKLAVAEAEKVAAQGGSNAAVVGKVREILGIA